MDCDQVFAALTAGPFPTGGPIDREVESHLAVCESCRDFAHALAPCDSGAPEALAYYQRNKLPVYRPASVLAPTAKGSGGGAGGQFSKVVGRPPGKIYRPTMDVQVAAFTVARQPLYHPLWDAFLVSAVFALIGLVCWLVGAFVM